MQQQKQQAKSKSTLPSRRVVRRKYKELTKSFSTSSSSSAKKRKRPKLTRRSQKPRNHIVVSNQSHRLDLPSPGKVPLKFKAYQESSRSSSSFASPDNLQRRLDRLKGYKHVTNCSQRVNHMQALWKQESLLREEAISKNQEADRVLSKLAEALFGTGEWNVQNKRLR